MTIATVPAVGLCRIPNCAGDPLRPGTARGYCIKHYWRAKRHGLCQAAAGCTIPAMSHIGLCESHLPEGIPA